MAGLITSSEQSVKNNIISVIALNEYAESRKTVRPRAPRVQSVGNQKYLEISMKVSITLVVIVVALKKAFPGLLLTIKHVTVCLFEGNDKRVLTHMETTWESANVINITKISLL